MRSARMLAAAGLAAVLVVTGCAGSKVAKDNEAAEQQETNQPAGTAAGTAAGSSGAMADSGAMIPRLTFPAEADESVGNLVNYNPYSPKPLTSTWLYEPMMVQNGISCEITPWLATDYEWEGADKLTFQIRDGVKWNDGEDFTAEDVAFTFNLSKQYPALDRGGVWNDTFGKKAESVTADGNSVVFKFTGNAAPKFQGIISQKILPEHIYSTVGDPTTYVDKDGIGTGPFKVANYNGRQLELARRDDYWQADKIKVEKLVLTGTYDASSAALKLGDGELDAYTGEIPNPQKTFVDADPEHNHFYYAPDGINVLTLNLTKAPFDDPKFREGVSYAMNKEEISLKATYGIMAPASQSGLKLPIMEKMLPDGMSPESTMIPFDVDKANQLLDAAGYAKGADGFRTNKDGSPLAITFSAQAGWIDFIAMADVIVNGMKAAGLNATVVQSAPDSVDQQKKSGDFDAMLEYLAGGCDYSRGLGSKLTSKQIPTKTSVLPNVERYIDPETDKVVDELAGSISPEDQKKYVGELVNTMMTEYPVTSLVYAPARIIYQTNNAVGWPSEEDPYAHPYADWLLMMTHLRAP